MSGVKRFEAHYLTDGVMGGKALARAEMVLASDYDRDTQDLRRDNAQLQFALEQEIGAYTKLKSERDELRAQVEAMRAALENAAKGILWLQASVPMSLRISKRASKDYNAAKLAALQEPNP